VYSGYTKEEEEEEGEGGRGKVYKYV